MHLKNKKNIFLLLLLFGIALYGIIYNDNIDKKNAANLVQIGKTNPEFLELHPEVADENYSIPKTDSINFVFRVIYSDAFVGFPYLIIIIIIFFATKDLYKLRKKDTFKNKMEKDEYKLNKEIYKSYIYSLIPILFMLILLILSLIYHFDLNFLKTCNGESLCYIPHLSVSFILTMIFNLTVISLYYINVSIITSKYIKNFVLNIIISFLLIFTIELFLQYIIGPFLATLTNDVGYGNLFSSPNLWYYDSVSYLQTICYTSISFMITFLIIKIQFKNNEII